MKAHLASLPTALLLGSGSVFLAGPAWAHIEIALPATANATSEIVFGVAHGCAGKDTYRVTIDIPAGVTSV